jgi:hypothetical protein
VLFGIDARPVQGHMKPRLSKTQSAIIPTVGQRHWAEHLALDALQAEDPIAENKGVTLRVEAPNGAAVRGDRDLPITINLHWGWWTGSALP